MLMRTVMVEVTIPVLMEYPESMGAKEIEEHINNSTSCFDNVIDDISEPNEGCWCGHGRAKFLREATEEDEKRWSTRVENEEKELELPE